MITLADLKLALRIDADDTSEDAYLTELEERAVKFVHTKSNGRYFGPPMEVTEYIPATGQRELYLANAPLPDGEYGDYMLVVTADGVAVDSADYDVRGRVIRHASAGWGAPWFAPVDVKLVYTTGYAEGEAPADIRQAVTGLVAHWWKNRTPVGEIQATTDIPLHVAEILSLNKRMVA